MSMFLGTLSDARLPFSMASERSMKRSTALDYARFPAAIGIIIFHVGAPGANIGYAALPFFCILLVFLAFPAAVKKDFTAYAASRAKRLLQPWAIWSLVYAALKLAEVGVSEARLETEFAAWMLLTGPAIHLWFLPFACALRSGPLRACSTCFPRQAGQSVDWRCLDWPP